MPLKYPSNFWRSLEMPLINCKLELKLKCVLPANGNNNDDDNCNILIILFLLSKTQNYMFPSPLYLQKTINNYQNVLAKDFGAVV